MKYTTLIEMLEKNCNSKKSVEIIYSNDNRISIIYQKLYDNSLKVLNYLQENHMVKDSPLVIYVNDISKFLHCFWGALQGGMIPVPVTVGENEVIKDKLKHILKILKGAKIITEVSLAEEIKNSININENNILVFEEIDFYGKYGRKMNASPHDTAFIQFSSGSTSMPKGVVLTHENLIANLNAITAGFQCCEADKTISWMPLTHDMGLIGFHLAPIYGGISQVLMPPSLFIRNPFFYLEIAEQYKGTILCSPNFGIKHMLKYLDKQNDKKIDLSQIRLIFNGAEPISYELCKEFEYRMKIFNLNDSVMFPVYGMAEASLAITFPKINHKIEAVYLNRNDIHFGKKIVEIEETDDQATAFVKVGYSVKDCEVAIFDDNDEILEDYYIGNIYIKGKNVTSGYYNNSEASKNVITADKWLKTGDVGFIHQKQLVITGRKKDIIFINGQNYYPADLEKLIENLNFSYLKGCAVCGVPNKDNEDEIVVFIASRYKKNQIVSLCQQIDGYLSRKIGKKVKYVIPIRNIPKTTSGKIQRYQLVKNYLLGVYNDDILQTVISEADTNNELTDTVLGKVRALFQKVLETTAMSNSKSFYEMGGDSLKAMYLINAVNSDYGTDISLNEVFGEFTINKIVSLIQTKKKNHYDKIEFADKRSYYKVLPQQSKYYLLSKIQDTCMMFNIIKMYECEGLFPVTQIKNVLVKLTERHEILRTNYHFIDGEVCQKIHDEIKISFLHQSLKRDELNEFINQFNQPFNLEEDVLLKVALLYVEDSTVLIFCMHHIIGDGTSFALLLKEFITIYNQCKLEPVELTMKDLVLWRENYKNTPEFQEDKEYWMRKYGNEFKPVTLPYDYIRPNKLGFQGNSFRVTIPSYIKKLIKNFAIENNTTEYNILFSVFNLLIYQYTNQEEFVIGVPTAGRSKKETENIIGMLINTLPIKVNIDKHMTYLGYLQSIGAMLSEDLAHQMYYSEELNEDLNIAHQIGRNALYDIVFNMQNMNIPEMILDGHNFNEKEVKSKVNKVDLTLDIAASKDGYEINVEYSKELFKDESVRVMIEQYINMIKVYLDHKEDCIINIENVCESDRKQLLYTFNQTILELEPITFISAFERQVRITPDKIAIRFGKYRLTYRELNEKANCIANKIGFYGEKSNSKILGLLMERSIERAVVIIGCLKTGNAYVPIECSNPVHRINYVLQDSKPGLLITDKELDRNIDYTGNIMIISNLEDIHAMPDHLNITVKPNDLAYIIYTSGTSGYPKGVLTSQSNLWAYIVSFLNEFKLTDDDIFLQQASYSFDAFIEEMFPILTVGGCVSICKKEEVQDIDRLARKIIEDQITIISAAPLLINELNRIDLESKIHTFISGGDVLKYNYIDKLIHKASVYNTYGPTETTVCVTYYKCGVYHAGERVSIGKPIANYKVYILNQNLQLVPLGAPGELCVGGLGVSKGYLNQEILTNEKFISNPYIKGERIYRTGDLARRLPSGNIEYLGRLDQQVNIRGYRIELGEIETKLLEIPSVSEAVVIDREDETDEKFLIAYIVGNKNIKTSDLKHALMESLPDYMIPPYFIQVDEIPLNVSGKVDKKALPDLQDNFMISTNYEQPSNETEEALVNIWREVLNTDRIGINDNFFELGGHSLKLVSIGTKIYEKLGIKCNIKDLFENQTIKDMANYIRNKTNSHYESMVCVGHKEYYDTSSSQRRMYMLQKLDEESISYNISGAIAIEGTLNMVQLKYAIAQLIQRHESFRTYFTEVNGEVFQKIDNNLECHIEILRSENREIHSVMNQFIKKFDLNKSPLYRIALIKESKERHILLFDMHHSITDGISMGIMINDFLSFYSGKLLSALKFQYKDYAHWHNKMLQSEKLINQKKYWIEKYQNEIPILNMPVDFIRPAIQSFEGNTIRRIVPSELYEQLNILSKQNHTTLYMTLLSAINILLYKYSGQEDIIIGSPVSGRSHAEVQNIIGMFVNTIAIRSKITGSGSFLQFLNIVKNNVLEAFENQDYPFEQLVDELKLKRDMSRNPLFDVMFTMQNTQSQKLQQIEEIKITRIQHDNEAAQFDLSFEAEEINEELVISLEYSTHLFEEYTIRRILNHLFHILETITNDINIIIDNIDMLDKDEKRILLSEFNHIKPVDFEAQTFYELFENQVNKTPCKAAVICLGESITYDKLNRSANQLAKLLRNHGAREEKIIGIMMEKSIDFIIGIIAIMKSGAAYLPVDPNYPRERVQYLLRHSDVEILLTKSNITNEAIGDYNIIEIDKVDYKHYGEDNLGLTSTGENLAYVIYTSGTTGLPKGVMVEHQQLVSVTDAWIHHYKLNTFKIKLLQLASISFDVFAGDLCRSLLTGGVMYLCPDSFRLEFKSLYEIMNTHRINFIESTPGFLLAFINYIEENDLNINFLKLLVLGSDTCSLNDYKRLINRYGKHTRVLNSYGVTEAAIDSSYYEAADEIYIPKNIVNTPIGKPLCNTAFYILDKSGNLQPVGVSGELYIGGHGVARGYYKNESLTNEKFIYNQQISGQRLYKTGDLARWLPNGNVEFLGRLDQQVKIRGYRIELKEIEKQLLEIEELNEAVVVDREDQHKMKFLCAYVVSKNSLDISLIKKRLAERLPDYMIPSYFVQVSHIPLTDNGKINRKKLMTEPLNLKQTAEMILPITDSQQKVAGIWCELLNIDQVGITDNFFELGGHSLKAIALASKIRKEFHAEIPLRELFKRPDIQSICEYIEKTAIQDYEIIEPIENKLFYETSSSQKRMYLLHLIEPESTGYNMSAAIRISGPIDFMRIVESLNQLIQRHEILRTQFVMKDGEIMQMILPELSLDIEYSDCCLQSIEKEMEQFIRPFDLNKAPLLRAKLIKADNFGVLLFDIHHIISDGLSISIMIKEIGALYNRQNLSPSDIQYKDYAAWHNKILSSSNMQKQKEYWVQQLSGELPLLNLPTDYVRTAMAEYEGAGVDFLLSEELTHNINKIAVEFGATEYMVLLSGIVILLFRYSGQEDIIVGSIVSGRHKIELEHMLGVFINTLALRNVLVPEEDYAHMLMRLKDNLLSAYENQDYPFEILLDQLNINRDATRNPIFDVMFSVEEDDLSEEIEIDDISFKGIPYSRNTVNFDLRFIASHKQNRIQIKMEYKKSLFTEKTIKRMQGHLENILKQVTSHAYLQLKEIKLLSSIEEQEILEGFNNTTCNFPDDQTFVTLFEQQVDKAPHAAAIIYESEIVTYGELNERSNQLARQLRKKGIYKDSIVAIIMERSIEMMVGIFAIIKAGGAYMPIAPDCPTARIDYIMENSQASLIVTHQAVMNTKDFNHNVINMDTYDYKNESKANLPHINNPEDLIYVIYTSGSTGNPKGVMIEHKALLNRIDWMQNMYPLNKTDRILQKTTYTFDVSVWEILWWAIAGASVCLLKHGQQKDVSEVVLAISKYKVTTTHFVPSVLTVFLSYLEAYNRFDLVVSLKRVFASGEALQVTQAKTFEQYITNKFQTQLINLYGPTEAAIDVSYFNCTKQTFQSTIPIGKPIQNIHLYILNDSLLLQPVGVPGELCISGVGLARGYVNNPDLTNEKFINHPFEAGKKLYKTGDLARWLPDGNIEYIGRIDYQIKLRGFRIELEEIESCILMYKGIEQVVVCVKKDKNGLDYLCGYLIAEEEISKQDLKKYLYQRLPEYMVPACLVQIPYMPLTSNGKLNREELPEPDIEEIKLDAYEEPANETEKVLVSIWKEILGLTNIGIHSNFFQIGGYSLKITLMISEILKRLGVEVPFRQVFMSPTIKELAAIVDHLQVTGYETIQSIEKKDYYEVSSAQKRMYMLQQFNLNNTNYNMPEFIDIKGSIDPVHLHKVFQALVDRHESLRTCFEVKNGKIVQILKDSVALPFEYIEAESDEFAGYIHSFVRPFQLNEAPLIRVKLLRKPNYEFILMIDMHHIISDGVSKNILVSEFIQLYKGEVLSPLKVQYKDYVAWQNSGDYKAGLQKQKEYWITMLSGDIPVLQLQTDFIRPVMQSFEGNTISVTLQKRLTEKINEFAIKNNSTTYMFWLSMINILLYRHSGQEDILIGTPVVGRTHPDIHSVVGMFVNTLVMRNYPMKHKTYKQLLEEIKENVLRAYENQDYSFDELVEELEIKKDIARNPLFDVMLTVQNDEKQILAIEDITLTNYYVNNRTSKFDLNFYIHEFEEDTVVDIQYCTKIFKEESVKQMMDQLIMIADSVMGDQDIMLGDINIISDNEKHKILDEFNYEQEYNDKNFSLKELFESQVAKTPDRAAVKFEDQYLTYKELNNRSNQIANVLKDHYVGTGDIVGILMEKSIDMIVAIMAIIKAGAAYLPIDPDYPENRIIYQLKDCHAGCVLIRSAQKALQEYNGSVINLSDIPVKEDDIDNLNGASNPSQLAYVIYTSGSTGKPKGVMIEQRNVVSLVYSLYERIYRNWNRSINVALLAPYVFDASVKQIFASLLNGHCLCLMNDRDKRSRRKLVDFYSNNQIIVSDGTPIILDILNDLYDTCQSELKVECFLIGGDVLQFQTLLTFKKNYGNQINIFNVYGPTECCVDSTSFLIKWDELEHLDRIPIGRALVNEKVYILDEKKQLVPIGAAGEIYIGGSGVGRGYVKDSALTQEYFIQNPFAPKEKMYRTGDLGKWMPDGNIIFLGRKDNQIKINGYRIETGEIEQAILKYNGIKECVVLVKTGSEGIKLIGAYYVSVANIDYKELKMYLGNILPHYMIPVYMLQIDEMPLTENGKIDRTELCRMPIIIEDNDIDKQPLNIKERELKALLEEMMFIENIGMNDNFFEIGGNSFVALKIISRLRMQYNVDISDLFIARTIREFAQTLQNREITNDALMKEDSGDISSQIQLTFTNPSYIKVYDRVQSAFTAFEDFLCSQKIDRIFPILPIQQYTLKTGLKIHEQIELHELTDEKSVIHAVQDVIKTFGLLRSMVYPMDKTLWVQYRLQDGIYFDIPILDLSHFEFKEKQTIKRYLNKMMDEATSDKLLYRVIVFKDSACDMSISWSFHHAIFDGQSCQILRNVFMNYYNNYKNKKLYNLTEVVDYDVFVNHVLKDLKQADINNIVKLFELDKFLQNQLIINKRLGTESHEGAERLFKMACRIPDTRQEYFQEHIWSISFGLFLTMLCEKVDLDDFPVLIYSYGRRHGQLYYDSIGEYLDVIPAVIEGVSNGDFFTKVNRIIKLYAENRFNFANSVLSDIQHGISRYFLPLEQDYSNQLLMFDFIGYKTNEQQMEIERYFESYLQSTTELHNTIGLEGITFQVMYSNERLLIMADGLYEKFPNNLKILLENKLNDLLEKGV